MDHAGDLEGLVGSADEWRRKVRLGEPPSLHDLGAVDHRSVSQGDRDHHCHLLRRWVDDRMPALEGQVIWGHDDRELLRHLADQAVDRCLATSYEPAGQAPASVLP